MSAHPAFEIKPLYDESDEITEYMVRGHVNRTDLLRQLNAEFPRFGRFEECDLSYEWRHARPDPTGNMVCFYDPSSQGARGAFACTIVEVRGPADRAFAETPAPAPSSEEQPYDYSKACKTCGGFRFQYLAQYGRTCPDCGGIDGTGKRGTTT